MATGNTSPVSLLELTEQYAASGDPKLLKEIERLAGECSGDVNAVFAPLAAMAMRNKQITAEQLAERLKTAEDIRLINAVQIGGNMKPSTAQVLALILGSLAVLGVSIAAVWVKNPQSVAFIFGVVFIATMLVIALVVPNPTPTQFMIFRTILAICVAGAAALVPGFLEVEVGKAVRAGGAMAVFVIIYFFSPARLAAAHSPAKSDKA